MTLMTNYLDNFESYLPEESRKDLRDELESSLMEQIDEQQEALGRSLNEQEESELLIKLGHPMKVAAAYLPDQQLLGGDYYPAYKKVLIIAFWIFAALSLLKMLPFGLEINFTVGNIIGSLITVPIVLFSSLLETGVWVFAWVTLSFYLLEKNQVNIDFLYAWSPQSLAKAGKKLSLSRVESAFEIVFTLLFLAWWNSLFNNESMFTHFVAIKSVSVSEGMQALLWPVNLVGAFSIIVSLIKLVQARWSKSTLMANLLIAVIDLLIIIYMLQFNDYVFLELSAETEMDVNRILDSVHLNIRITLAVIAGFVLWDISSSLRKLKA